MELLYENQIGKLRLYGGRGLWNITNIEGLGLSDKSFQVVQYAMTTGQVTLDEKAEARFITLRGDCCATRAEVAEGIRILNQKGLLTIVTHDVIRRIGVYCSHFEMEKPKHGLRGFIIQLTADDPFFMGKEPLQQALYRRDDLVSSSFTLPCVFTRRISDTVVYNRGDVAAEPVLTVMCKQVGENNEAQGFSVCNRTTGAVLTVEYDLSLGEVVTIDVANRRIVSSMPREDNYYGNLIYYLDEESFLYDMYLAVGENHFVTSNYSGADMVISCELEEKYLEAVI